MSLPSRVGRLLVLALVMLSSHSSALVMGGSVLAQVGYAASFAGRQPIMGARETLVDWDAPGWCELDAEFTVAMWSKGGSLKGPLRQGTVMVLDSASDERTMELATNQLILGSSPFISPDPLAWHHRAWVVHGNGTVVQYFDGVFYEESEVGEPFSLRRPDTTLYLGGSLVSRPPFSAPLVADLVLTLRGELDELMLFSRPLGADAVRALYLRPARGAAAAGAVLHYSFDVGSCALGGSLLAAGCALSGDGVAKNLGSAGEAADLLSGRVNDDMGFGRSYSDSWDKFSGKRWLFNQVGMAPSRVPWGGLAPEELAASHWPLSASVPLVVQLAAGVAARVPVLDLFGPLASAGLALGSAPVGGGIELSRGSDGQALSPGDALSSEPFLEVHAEAAGNFSTPLAFALIDAGTGLVVQEVHVWPIIAPWLEPELAAGVLELDALPGDSVPLSIGSYISSLTGEPFNLTCLSIPVQGELLKADAVSPISTGSTFASSNLLVFYKAAYEARLSDGFRLAVVSAEDGRTVATLQVLVKLQLIDQRPVSSPGSAAVHEDDAHGVEVVLAGVDDLERFGLVFAVTSLPELGKLFAEDEQGVRRAVDRSFSTADVGPSLRQFASRVIRVSSWDDTFIPGDLNYHPLGLLGPPTCGQTRLLNRGVCVTDEPGLPALGELVQVFLPAPLDWNWYAARVVALNGSDGVDVDLLDNFLWFPDADGTSSYRQCATDPGTSECSPELLANYSAYEPFLSAGRHTTLGMRNVTLDRLRRNYLGAWSPLTIGLTQRLLGMTRDCATFLGPEFAWGPLNQSATLRNASSLARPFTEFFEVGFDVAVYPVSVFIGMPRGGGAVVNVLARDVATGRWQSLYQGSPQLEKNRATSSKGLYFTFDEQLCRAPFKTDAIRAELDTEAIEGWNFVDYVELIGAGEMQPAVLRGSGMSGHESGGNRSRTERLVYVPDPDQSGMDAFSFLVTDCMGSPLRESASAVVQVGVAAKPDAPTASLTQVSPLFRCGVDAGITMLVSMVDMDGDEVALELVAAPVVGTVAIASPRRAATTNSAVRTAAFWETNVTYSLDCAELPGYSTEVTLALSVKDSSTSALATPLSVTVRVLKEDPSRMSVSVKALCGSMLAVNVALALLALAWATFHRKARVIRASQFPFLALIVLGTIVSSLTIALAIVDDSVSSITATFACNGMVWTYCAGFMLTFAAIYVKLFKVSHLFSFDFAMDMRFGPKEVREHHQNAINTNVLLRKVVLMVAVDVLACLAMTIWFPLKYERVVVFADPQTGYAFRTEGSCTGNHFQYFAAFIALYHLAVLAYVERESYRGRQIHSALSESKYINLVLASSLQILLISVPVLHFTNSSSANTTAFVRSGAIFINNLTCTALIFVPKVLMRVSFETESEESIIATSTSTTSRPAEPAATSSSKAGSGPPSSGLHGSGNAASGHAASGHAASNKVAPAPLARASPLT
jgi:hypothetical protein